ncbi:MAG: DUF4876 domain-containing protein [Bacteroidales bacterium]
MKKIYALFFTLLLILSSCSDDKKGPIYQTMDLAVQLVYPPTSGFDAIGGITVQMKSTTGVSYKSTTDGSGKAGFQLPVGVYEVSATDKRKGNGKSVVFTASQGNIVLSDGAASEVALNMVESVISQVIIKELYVGGCQKDDGSGTFGYDKYLILYNNSDEVAELQNMCLGMVLPYNSTIANADIQNGALMYETEGWIPAGLGYFYFKEQTSLNPGEQIVVAFNNANDNTQTYTNSVNLSNPEYYVTFDPELFDNKSYHPSPAASIPTAHYLPGCKYGTGNAWTLSNTSPAFFLFVPENSTPEAFAADAGNVSLYNGSSTQVRKKVPVEWILDGVEVFKYGATNNSKRFTSAVDAGSVDYNSGYGYSVYRNVDKDATESLEGNAAKLVYNYSFGTTSQNGTTDPSGIDAEASIKQGARIIYQDTNNSGNDFHQRSQASLKD